MGDSGGNGGPWGVQEGGGVKGESYGTVLQHSKFLMKSAIGFQKHGSIFVVLFVAVVAADPSSSAQS